MPTDRPNHATRALWTSLSADAQQLAAAYTIVRAAAVNEEAPAEAIQQAVECAVPVWVRTGEATPSFLSGMARVLDIFGVFDKYNSSPTPDLADSRKQAGVGATPIRILCRPPHRPNSN